MEHDKYEGTIERDQQCLMSYFCPTPSLSLPHGGTFQPLIDRNLAVKWPAVGDSLILKGQLPLIPLADTRFETLV